LSVTLPIRILSMLSVDPQTSFGRPLNVPTATHDMVNGLALHFGDGDSEHLADSPPPYRTRPPSLEHPQNNIVSVDNKLSIIYTKIIYPPCDSNNHRRSRSDSCCRNYSHATTQHQAPGVLPHVMDRKYTTVLLAKRPPQQMGFRHA